MRQAEIYRKGILAGILTEDGGEYRFCYFSEGCCDTDMNS